MFAGLYLHSAWLRDEDGDLIGKINQRVGALTGLNVDTAEQLQVTLNKIRGKNKHCSLILYLLYT
jgi:hypothetical protein